MVLLCLDTLMVDAGGGHRVDILGGGDRNDLVGGDGGVDDVPV